MCVCGGGGSTPLIKCSDAVFPTSLAIILPPFPLIVDFL